MIWSSIRKPWSDRRLAILIAALALAKGLVWIAIMPAFKIADEPSHFENVQYRAEYLRVPRYDNSGREIPKVMHPGAAPEIRLAWNMTNARFRKSYQADTRTAPEEAELQRLAHDPSNRRGDGQISSMSYPGVYYDIGVVAYDLFRTSSVLVRLCAVRFVSVLFGVMAALSTFFAARLIMRDRSLAFAAALLVTLQPMEAQMTAAVNNDAAILGFGALIFYLQVRFLLQSPAVPSLRQGLLLGVLCGLAVMSKPQGWALLPASGLVCGLILTHNLRSRSAWLFCGAAALGLLVFMLPGLWANHERGIALVPGDSATSRVSIDFYTFATTLDEGYRMYLFKSTFGMVGWLEYGIDMGWISLIVRVMDLAWYGLIAAVAARLLWPNETQWLSMRGLLFCIGSALFAVAFILFAEHRFRMAGYVGVIQGRNFLFGLPSAAIAVCACWGALVPARFRTMTAASLVTCAVALHVSAVLTVVRYHFGS